MAMARPTILVSYAVPREGLSELFDRYEVHYPQGSTFSEQELRHKIVQADGLLSVHMKVGPALLDLAPRLKIISHYGVGYDDIDVAAASARNIVVANAPNSVTESTAEMSLALMLALGRRIVELNQRIKSPAGLSWGLMQNLGTSLVGRKLGIIGLGRIGKALARRARALGMEILYHNRRPLPSEEETAYGAKYCSLEALLTSADFVSVHAPLTESSHHLLNAAAFRTMKKTAFLVNTSRGAVLDQEALIRALQDGEIAGAALDVLDGEPHVPEVLKRLDNVILTPHMGSGTYDTRIAMAREAEQSFLQFFAGETVTNQVNG